MRRLTDRQAAIFTRLLEGDSMTDVGAEYGIVRERCRQIFREVRDKLVYWSWVINKDEEDSAPEGYEVTLKEMRAKKNRWLSYLKGYQRWATLDSRSCTK